MIRYFKCIGRKHHNGCKKANIQKDSLENLVIESLIGSLTKPKVKEQLISKLLAFQKEENIHKERYKVLLKEKRQVDMSLQNLMTAVENGLVTRTTSARLKELEEKQLELEEELLKEQTKMTIEVPKETMDQYYEEALRMQPELIVSFLVNKIVLYDDKALIYLNTPLPNGPDESRDCFSYTWQKIYSIPYYGAKISVTIKA